MRERGRRRAREQRAGRAVRARGGRREREKRRKEKKEKRKEEKEIEEKKNGREGKEKEGGGAVRASGDRGCGRPRVACGTREVGHAVGGEREKEGAGFAAAGHDASRWMGKEM